MIMTEFDINVAREVWREEALEEGLERGREEGLERGRGQGLEEAARRIIQNMRAHGMDEKTIADLTGFPIDNAKRDRK